jgi:hypothetical protein
MGEIGQPAAEAAAVALDAELADLRAAAYSAQDSGADRSVRLALRGRAHALSLRATGALVAAGAGRSMLAGSAGGRLARVAEFLLVQGQDAEVRGAQLEALSGRGPSGSVAG